MAINIGDVRRMSVSYQEKDLTYVDPTTVTLNIVAPSGAITTYVYLTDAELVQDSAGQYYADYLLDESGIWKYQWISTGTLPSMEEGSWSVVVSGVIVP